MRALLGAAVCVVLLGAVVAPAGGSPELSERSLGVSVGSFDTSGVEAVVLASFDAGGSETLWAAPGSRWKPSGDLAEGDVELAAGTSITRVMVPKPDGSLLRLNDGGGVVLRSFFGPGGAGADLTVHVVTGEGTASFPASDVKSAGSNFVNFRVPEDQRAVLRGIEFTRRFVLALTRPAAPGSGSTEEGPEEGSGGDADSGAVPSGVGGVVLSGTVTFGQSTSSGNAYVGYGGAGQVGSLTAAETDGEVFRASRDVVALAQFAGTVSAGPAEGLTDPVWMSVKPSVDLSGGFFLEVGGRLLSSADAVYPGGQAPLRELRWWLWDSPCGEPFRAGEQAPIRIVAAGSSAALWDDAYRDTALQHLSVTGATLEPAFDPGVDSYAAAAPADAQTVTVSAAGPALGCGTAVEPPDADPRTAGHQVELGPEGATITVTSTAADGTERGYSIVVGRGSAPAALKSLDIVGVGPVGFDPHTRRYDTAPDDGSGHVTVGGVPAGTAGQEMFSYTAGDSEMTPLGSDGQVRLRSGRDTLIAVRTTTDDSQQQSYYIVNIHNPQNQQQQQQAGSDGSGIGTRDIGPRSVGDLRHSTDSPKNSQPAVPRSDDADDGPRLSALTIDPGTLTPGFDAEVFDYAAAVAHDTDQVTVTAAGDTPLITPKDADPDTAGHQIALISPSEGKTAQTAILITATDGTAISAYTLTVTRAAPAVGQQPDIGPRQDPPSSDASLSALSTDHGTLFPAFAAATTLYTVPVSHDVADVTVTATATETGSTVVISHDGQTVTGAISLDDGANEVAVTVTAPDTTTTRTYDVSIVRTPAAEPDHTGFLGVDSGWFTVCGLRVDHTISCTDRGNNSWWHDRALRFVDQVPAGMFEGVSVTKLSGCGTRSNGELYCWSTGSRKEVYKTGVHTGALEFSAEFPNDLCALLDNGDMACYADPFRQVVQGPFKAVVSARDAACALKTDGIVRCFTTHAWTDAYLYPSYRPWSGATVRIDEFDIPYPNTVFKFIAAGYAQACGIREDDSTVRCWRWDSAGHGAAQTHNVRTYTPADGEFTWIDVGTSITGCGVRTDGTVDCWTPRLKSFPKLPGESTIGYKTISVAHMAAPCGLRKDRSMACSGPPHGVTLGSVSPWRPNSQLLGIEVEDGSSTAVSLSPAFKRETTAYTATVPNGTDSVTVAPELTNSLAHYVIYSDTGGLAEEGGVVDLSVGQNVINVRVESADRSSVTTYTVTVTRGS